jgi:hypothetical protein
MTQREIKFRAWDKLTNEMKTKNVEWNLGLLLSNRDDFVLMQFTGLKDKTGKEIYEGDIVRCGEFDGDGDAKNWEVIFGADNYAAFDLDGWDGETNGLSEWLSMGFVEVIVNKYENPELLK